MHVFDALSAASNRLHTVNVFPEERDAAALTDLATRRRSLYSLETTSVSGPVRCSSGADCTAKCDCVEEFTGSETCSLTASLLLERQSLRLRLVQSITKLIASEDADLESVVGWINTLLQVAQVPDELSEDAAHLLLGAADSIIAAASRLGVSTDIVTSLLTAVDAVVQGSNDRSVRRRRVLSMGSASADTRRLLRSENELHNSTLTRTASTLTQFPPPLEYEWLTIQELVDRNAFLVGMDTKMLTPFDTTFTSPWVPLSSL
eukprot:gene28993-32740_t